MVYEKHWPLHSSEKSPMYLLSLWSLTPLVQCILIIFINRLRWDAYLHMYMLFLVENLYKNSFLQLAHLLSFLMLFIAVNSPNFVYQEGGCEDSKESPTIFTETVRCRSSFFFNQAIFLFSVLEINICFKSDFNIAYLLSLSIFPPAPKKILILLCRGCG